MNKTLSNMLYSMLVLIPYLVLLGYSIAVYPGLPDELEHGYPKILIFLPALISVILPISYGAMVFFFSHYLKAGHYITIAAFMDLGLIGLTFVVYLIKTS